ncbi:MAG: hypothetical protein AABX31_04265, partial [Nanoarchaeota archaeon]
MKKRFAVFAIVWISVFFSIMSIAGCTFPSLKEMPNISSFPKDMPNPKDFPQGMPDPSSFPKGMPDPSSFPTGMPD